MNCLGKILLTGLVAVTTWGVGGAVVTDADTNPDLTAALKTAPQGIKLSGGFVTGGETNGDPNDASIMDTTNPATTDTQALLLTRGLGNGLVRVGSMWSQNGDKFDLSQDQTASLWLYFGDKQANAGDGMALVLQNDPNGTHAAIQPNSNGDIFGESLGVWGSDADDPDAADIASTAIQDSWALEFDTYMDNQPLSSDDAGTGVGFDTDVPQINGNQQPHIAWNYPGDPDAYRMESVGFFFQHYMAVLNHRGVIEGQNSDFLSNGAWHHLTLHWDHSQDTMTYTFDDRDPQTDAPVHSTETQTAHIDPTEFNNPADDQLLWGFTAAESQNTENNLVVAEQLPGVAAPGIQTALTDTTTGATVQPTTVLRGNDHVRLTYTANYATGSAPQWSHVVAQLRLPTGITYTSATVSDAADPATKQSLDLSGLTRQELTTTLGNLLRGQSQTITLHGVVQNPTQTTTIPAATSEFVGTEAVAPVTTDAWQVQPSDSALTVTPAHTMVPVNQGLAATLTGQVTTPVNASIANHDLRLHVKVGATRLRPQALSDTDAAGHYQITLPATDLQTGDNAVQLYVTDATGDTSPTVTVDVNVGVLQFVDVSPDASFQPTALTGNPQLVGRQANQWQLSVEDTQAVGTTWDLLARMSQPFTSSGEQLDGSLVYRNGNDSPQIIGANNTTILQHTKTTTDGAVVNVTGNWGSQQGILLDISGDNAPGVYSGDITWTLQNAPE